MTRHRGWARVIVGVFGLGLAVGPVSAASAGTNDLIAPCRCVTLDTRDFAVPADPPFTFPYERPYGPVGSGIYTIN